MRAKAGDLLVCESPAMREVLAALERIAPTGDAVLIDGEPGTGRELVARLVHAMSPRGGRELVTVRAGASPRQIFIDEIEGSSASAFERATGGTLLVKDVWDLSRSGQRKLARVLRDRSSGGPDIRVVATAEPGLEHVAETEMFSRALYERLTVWTVHVPPLRDRAADIVPLTRRLLHQHAAEIGRRRLALSVRAAERLVAYPWPGNVAELKRVARRLVVRVRGARVDAGDIDAALPVVAERVPLEELSLEELVKSKLAAFLRRVEGYAVGDVHEDVMAKVERPLLDLVMEHTGGNQVRAAEILGLSRNTLRKKLEGHGLLSRAKTPVARRRSK